jgi:hypothetical protein
MNRTIMSKLSPADQSAMKELFASGRHPGSFTEEEYSVWTRWEEAFAKTGDDMPFARTRMPYDPWL